MPERTPKSSARLGPAWIAILYAAISVIWIATSDRLLGTLPIEDVSRWQTFKGTLFVVFTAVLLYLTISRLVRSVRDAERRLAETDRLYATVIENTGEGVCQVDANSKIVFVNGQLAQLLGYSKAELIGRPFYDMIAPADRELLNQKFKNRSEGKSERYDLRLLTREAREIPMLVSGAPTYDGDGRYIGSLAMLLNLTEQKKLESELRHSQKLDAVGRFAGGIAHDFNNLLGIIIGYTSIVQSDMPAESPSRRSLQQVLNASDRASSLIKQLLAFSRKQTTSAELIDLNASVLAFSEVLPRVIGEDIELRMECATSPAPVTVGTGQIEQVLLNLASNARDAMPNGGRLVIQTLQLPVDKQMAQRESVQPGLYAVLRVSDTGTGMDAQMKALIFEPFFTTKPEGRGTGLGLSTVQSILRQNGGFIVVDSELGRGSTFTLYFSCADCQMEPAENKLGAFPVPSLRGNETILLVEDEDSLRNMTKLILESNGYNVIEARDGTQALRLSSAHAGTIDLLLTDIVMPGMTGLAVAEQLHRERPETKIAFMSGYADPEQLREVGPAEMIEKPTTPEGLLLRLRTIFDSKPKQDRRVG